MADDGLPNLEEPARQATRGMLKGVSDWLSGLRRKPPADRPTRSVLILGAGGTGKTTFARLMSGDLDWLDHRPGEYAESTSLERFGLADDPDIEAVVAPGQLFRRPSTWPDLLRQVAAGEYRGVVLMNAYGYHTFSTPSYQNHQLYTGSKPDFLKAYYEDRRADEVRVLQQVVPHLSACRPRVWLLSVVSKQDLWGSQQKAAEEHYLRGPYAAAAEPLVQAMGTREYKHETVFASLVIRNLETIAGERLQANEAGYDMRRLVDSLRTLLSVMAGLKAWEEGP